MKLLTEPTLKNLQTNFGEPPKKQNELLKNLGEPHIASFNYFTEKGLALAIADLDPVEFDLPNNNDRIKLQFGDAVLSPSMVPMGLSGVRRPRVMPTECRQRHGTYKGRFVGQIQWSVNGTEQKAFAKDFGEIPIMLKSNKCHLSTMTPAELVSNGEHEQEWGGYFIIKGLERLVRMLLMTRRNYPIAITRSGWTGRGPLFSNMGVIIRCVREDETSANNVLHYVNDGTVKLMFSHRRILYYAHLVLILKALCDVTDKYIHTRLLKGYEHDLHYTACVEHMIRLVHEQDLHTHEECKAHLGKIFRVKFYECPPWWSDIEIADYILQRCLMIHLDDSADKFDMLVLMCQKLFVFAGNKCLVEGVDSVMMQEVLLGGHLYLGVLKEKMQTFLAVLKSVILKRAGNTYFTLNVEEMKNCARMSGTFEKSMEAFLATGNITSQSGLGLMQDKGLTIIPENINRMRYMSHFKAVHRGSFFQEMRTTEVRQLLPDAWGFICPVHTPDGSPCGLLNHLTLSCVVTTQPDKSKLAKFPDILQHLGMKTVDKCKKKAHVVLLDGKVMGYVDVDRSEEMTQTLRMMKINGDDIPQHTEIVLVKAKETKGQFPGLFLFTGPTRMMRPLMNLRAGKIEYVGTFEQVYMEVAVRPEEAHACTTHVELSLTGFMSNLAHLIPMPDCNQSPRNMYQCQMGKQTMGTPCHTWDLQAETKLYRLQTPTSPLFRPVHHDNIGLDDFAMGTNAIVAVISYTGYDMEDAMIINKSSYERGLAHGSMYKSEFIELQTAGSYFCRDPHDADLAEFLDTDGLPHIGRKIEADEPIYCFYDADRNTYAVHKSKAKEECYINSVRLCGDFNVRKPQIACLTYRVPRNPTVGDKFASRAGQKGICSQKWQSIDLPFTESGLVPDIVFNPHGFPSRMTIAMMIEIMAGKSGATHGLVHDATPFKFDEDDTAIDYFGRLLEAGGYDYYGTETMYSGIDGREMKARIFIGVVHYQRLRHMVSDKYQVRSTGPTDMLTRQPLKGRKRGGGVRFGEMERDSLISHGAPFLLQDRLLHCTDKSLMCICRKCHSLLGLTKIVTNKVEKAQHTELRDQCLFCGGSNSVSQIEIPYIYKYFAAQLGACNISLLLKDDYDS